jgi:beta-lactamase regulating signal transducer with metallopeptidase domain
MALGTSLFLIALGAILRFAVADAVPDIDLSTIGVILMIVGVVGMIISLFTMSLWRGDRRGRVVEDRRVVERDPYV